MRGFEDTLGRNEPLAVTLSWGSGDEGTGQGISSPPDAAEGWRPVVGYEGAYEVSSLGRIRSLSGHRRQRKILKQDVSGRGYSVACLSGGARGTQRWIEVHLIVARAFLGPPPPGLEVDHENGIKTDARLSNLRYLTHRQNMARRPPGRCGMCRAVGHYQKTCPSRAAATTPGAVSR